MNIKTDTVVIYASFYVSALEAGFDDAQRGVYFDGLLRYAFTGKEPEYDNAMMRALFLICKEQISANIRKYKKAVQAGKNGKKGGAPKGNQNARRKADRQRVAPERKGMETTGNTTDETTLNETEKETDTLTDTVNESGMAHTPTLVEEATNADLAARRDQFFEALKPYVEYWGKEEIQRFYNYWSETTPDKRLMRFEQEEFWELPNRVAHWINNAKR